MDQLAFQTFKELILCLAGSQAGDALQLTDLALFDLLGFLPLGFRLTEFFLNGLFLLFEVFDFPVEGLFLLLDATLLTGNLTATLFHVPICIAADLVCFFLGLNKQFLFLSFGGTVGFVDDLFCLIFRTSDFRFRYAFAVGNA